MENTLDENKDQIKFNLIANDGKFSYPKYGCPREENHVKEQKYQVPILKVSQETKTH
jgi:hypothetical protein